MIHLILARAGHGKSTLARELVASFPDEAIVVHDPQAEHPDEWLRVTALDTNCPVQPGGCLLLDEVDMLAPATGYTVPWLRPIIHLGRHDGITVVGIARRPANIHRDISALARRVILGKIVEQRDLDYCARQWGAVALECRALPPYTFLDLDV